MTRQYLSDVADGQQLEEILLVRDKQLRTNRNGDMYLQLELGDRSGAISGRYWNTTEEQARTFDTGDFLNVRGRIQQFQGQLQIIVNNFDKAEPEALDIAEFLPATTHNIEELESELRSILGEIDDPYLQAISQAYLIDETLMRNFATAPAGIRNHHAYIGGLLEHVVSILRIWERLIDLYPMLDKNLMRIGIFLHDIGKTKELNYSRVFQYSDEGQLIGHLVIGVEILNEKRIVAEELLGEPIPDSLVMQLKHLILSHHGTYEFGSPRLPMTPEAIAIHHLDNFDAKVQNFSRTIAEDTNSTQWTAYDPSTNRRLYKRKESSNDT